MVEKEVIQTSRILIVDDEAANVLLLERILQQGGYISLSKTTDPREVLKLFTLFQPDLILLDIMMPHVDGFSLMMQLRSRIPDNIYLPILVLTADVSPKVKQKALSLAAKDYLTKPLDATEVLLRVYNLLETRWLYLQLQEQIKMLEAQSAEHGRQSQRVHIDTLERLARQAGVAEPQIASIRQIAVQRDSAGGAYPHGGRETGKTSAMLTVQNS